MNFKECLERSQLIETGDKDINKNKKQNRLRRCESKSRSLAQK